MSKGRALSKASIMSVLILGLDDKELVRALTTPADMRKDAEHRKAWLESDEEGAPAWKTGS